MHQFINEHNGIFVLLCFMVVPIALLIGGLLVVTKKYIDFTINNKK
jgi:hypothetical protein